MENKGKCDIKRCKAACCTNVPIPKSHLFAFNKKIVRDLHGYIEDSDIPQLGGMIVRPVTDPENKNNVCPFLTANYRCNIYDKRPLVCRMFGEGGHSFLTCDFKNGGDRVTRNHSMQEKIAEGFSLAQAVGFFKKNK